MKTKSGLPILLSKYLKLGNVAAQTTHTFFGRGATIRISSLKSTRLLLKIVKITL